MVVDTSRKYQPYFQAYLTVHNIKNGDNVRFVDYSSWITKKHDEFRKLKVCLYCNGYPPEVQQEFEKFILGVQE